MAQNAPPPDAAKIYAEANDLIRTDCPASSNLSDYKGYPPYSPAWQTMETDAFWENRMTLDITHKATSTNFVNWPPGSEELNTLRNLANQIGDAALYLDLHGNDAQAIERVKDLMHMADLLENHPKARLFQLLVAVGIRALTMDRIMVISSNIQLSENLSDQRSVQVTALRQMITTLVAEPSVEAQIADVQAQFANLPVPDQQRFRETLNRVRAECSMSAMSLASHLFLYEKHRWPNSLDELIPDYLPLAENDPWGDGKETFGYILIPHGLPDHSDRPLVYFRANSRDGLFFRLDEPFYSFYTGDGSNQPPADQKHGGEFLDVARWVPNTPELSAAAGSPTTQPLP